MNGNVEIYEPPQIADVGDSAELTRITSSGGWIDSPGWGWWL
ncbi:lasso RiPP family leader peptide-containing protein [Nocardiopsis kunsanensis]|uniref:Lasso RiPP family leader peptide-containing protein n=1 Tax=Nocardiopsis kunsanensis TaxID=141693 RepID=A0A918X962_9ACTN|nr:lasso RiPP family leader peptide-containing protein [Nocardiopsis kunsanensis]GHD19294.1 hypothetical protein GCM10007147_10380 [Nocardiopsis kunsanensis]